MCFRLTADRMEAQITLYEEEDRTDEIQADIHRIEAQIEELELEDVLSNIGLAPNEMTTTNYA